MKTGMEWPLGGLVAVLALILLGNMWSGMQVDIAANQVQASAGASTLPAPALMLGEWIVKAVVGLVMGGLVTAGIAALVVWVRKQWRASAAPKWAPGPNANWGRERGPKAVSDAELMRMMMYQQMAAQNGGRMPARPMVQEVDDEPTIRF
jgi:hypothetical protein